MHGNSNERRALEREALRNVINQWNANRLDLFELSEPNEDLEFHGVMRFYFQDSGQKVATKCIRVASDATVSDVIGTLVEKFRPDMRMLSVPQYALYELHEGCPERRMAPDEKPLLVQLNWHVDDREGRFLLKNIDDKTANSMGSLDSNASFRRKLSKREKKQLKKQEKLSRMKSENGDLNDKDSVAEKLYTELPETSFTRSISNPEAVMRRRRQQKLEKKLQQFRSKDGGPDTGGTLKIYGEALCKDVPYKTLLLSVRDCAGAVVREMLDKYGLTKTDPSQWCLVQVTQQPGMADTEYVLDDDECPLSILMTSPNTGSIMFHVRRRPADCAPRKRKKKPARDLRGDSVPMLIELEPDGSSPPSGDATRTIRLTNDIMEVGSANGAAVQLYGPHVQPRHCVINVAGTSDGVATTVTPSHPDAHVYVNGQRVYATTPLQNGAVVKFGHGNSYRYVEAHEERTRPAYDAATATAATTNARSYESRSPRALSPTDTSRENIETTFDLEGNVETVSTASGPREDNRSLGSSSENRLSGLGYMNAGPRGATGGGQDPILPAVLEFPEEPQEQFLARVVTHLDVTTPTFRLAPAYTLYLCARYRASTHYRPELTPTERAHKLTVLLQHAAALVRHTIQDRSTESTSQGFWLANASELLHFLKSDRHVSAFSLQAQDTLADAVQLAFKNLVACLTDELSTAMAYLMSVNGDDHPREVINILSVSMNLLRKCRVNAALTIQLFSQLFYWISAKALSTVISNGNLCTRAFGVKLYNRLRNLQAWAESQGLELAAECHLAKIVQCAHLLQAPKYTPEELANLSAVCFKLNSMQLGALLMQYKPEPGEQLAPPSLLEHASKAAESVADELLRAEGRPVALYDDPTPSPAHLLLPDDGYSCDVVHGVPPGLADFLQPLQAAGLCRLAAQPTSSGQWTVYMNTNARPTSAMSTTQPEIQVIRLHKAGGGMGLSIVAAKGAGQERLGIYIKSVVPGGAADRDGRLAAGDQLLSVDGQSLLGITQEKAAEFLQRTGSIVTLEVAKAGAVYHGLATLLQQPSPQPHRALEAKSNIEDRKFTVPTLEPANGDPMFSLQVTDFSEPSPRDVTMIYDESGKAMRKEHSYKSWKDRANSFKQKSYSIDDEVRNPIAKRGHYLSSSSLQDLSSSSSLNTCVHESNLDLSRDYVKQKNWRSPYEIRYREALGVVRFEEKAVSVPDLNNEKAAMQSRCASEDKLDDKLTDKERLEILKLLHDWSLNGSDSNVDFNMNLSGNLEKETVEKSEKSSLKKADSEPDLSPKNHDKNAVVFARFNSETTLKDAENLDRFDHKCKYRNCIFNVDFTPSKKEPKKAFTKLKSILKYPARFSPDKKGGSKKATEPPKIVVRKFNSELVRCDSLERLSETPRNHKKFPDAYIVTRHKKPNGNIAAPPIKDTLSPKVPFKCQKSWKSCSDIKCKKAARRCCRYAKKTCPESTDPPVRSRSCSCLERVVHTDVDYAARLAALVDVPLNRPRRMSERDLPSKVDSEQQQQRPIPSSKSVPALHQIHSPTGEQAPLQQQQQPTATTNNRPNNAAAYHENYSRTSSNNSINQNGQQQQQQVRSRSTHNLHQQDAGFYQNLSVYRNKVPSPQQLGDRTSALHSSQNSLHSSVMANSQRPSSAYYPPANANPRPNNLHQSIPNLKSPPPSSQRLQNDVGNLHQSIPNLKAIPDGRTGSYLNQQYGQNYYPQYMRPQQGGYPSPEVYNNPYGGQNQPYPSPTHNVPSSYPNSIQQPLHINPNSRLEDRQEIRYNNVGGGLLREDVYRHSQNSRHDEIMRYPSQTNVRISEAQINEMRGSKSEDALRYHLQQNEMPRYASSGNIREHKGEVSTAHIRQNHDHRLSNEDRHLRGAAKLAEMSEEVRRRQNRIQHGHQQPQQQLPNRDYYQQQQQQQQYYNHIMSQNTQNMQNLNVSGQYAQNSYGHGPLSPTYKIPPIAPKPNRKDPDPSGPPDLPPTSTHPLYSASSQDPPKMSFYPVSSAAAAAASSKIPRDPWTREEQERQQEARREAARQWQEQQIRELTALPYRTAQQEEQLRVLKLEREFQRRAMEAQQEEEGDEDTEKESPIPEPLPLPVSSQTVISTLTSTTVSSKSEPNQAPPMSILKPGATNNGNNNHNNNNNNTNHHQQQQQQHSQPSPTESAMTLPPAPPERGSSFAVMSMRGVKESTKRVSFNDVAGAQQQGQQQQQQQTPNSLQIEEIVREDPNSFIRQAESMLASPVTPTDPTMPGGVPMSTPGVIGAQEVYRDPRTRRLAEQAQKRDQQAVPEKLSFKEKMKMFAMETGEQETPKDKSKISRAQRDIDNLSSPPTSGLVH